MDNAMRSLQVFAVGLILIFNIEIADSEELCQSEYFSPACKSDEVVVMDSAKYGRMKLNKCVKESFGYVGCSSDVMTYLDASCSGLHSCNIRVLDETFNNIKPCHEDLKSYLEATYHCVKVVKTENHLCRSYKPVPVTLSSGFIASHSVDETGCGSADTPWSIEVPEGQKIKMTLYDFAFQNESTIQPKKICRVYATLRETSATRSMTICGGQDRIRDNIYVSSTNVVEIRILNSKTPQLSVQFLIKFEAIGCPNPVPPEFGWMERDEDMAIIGCDTTGVTHRLTCNGTEWQGPFPSCEMTGADSQSDNSIDIVSLPFGVSIFIIVVLAVVVGTVIVIVGLLCLRRQLMSNRRDPGNIDPTEHSDGSSTDTAMKPQPQTATKAILPPGVVPGHHATLVSYRENEYASMRLLGTEGMYEHQNTINRHRHIQSPTQDYDSPHVERKLLTFLPGHHEKCATLPHKKSPCPQYYDIDPNNSQKIQNKKPCEFHYGSHTLQRTPSDYSCNAATLPIRDRIHIPFHCSQTCYPGGASTSEDYGAPDNLSTVACSGDPMKNMNSPVCQPGTQSS